MIRLRIHGASGPWALCVLIILLKWPFESTAQLEQCFTSSSVAQCIANVTSSYVQLNASSAALIAAVSTCLQASTIPSTKATIHIIVPQAPIASFVAKRAKEYEFRTGVKVVLDQVNMFWVTKEIMADLENGSKAAGWLFDPSGIGIIANVDGFADLGPFLKKDKEVQYEDWWDMYQDLAAVYAKKTIAIPLDGDLFLMYYRADLFKRYNLEVPQTWDDFLDIARRMNGTDTDGDGKPDLFGACFDVAPGCKASWMVAAVAGPYIQYKGTSQGFWVDPDSIPNLKPLMNNPGMAAALSFWKEVMPYTNPTRTCPAGGRLAGGSVNADFQAGRCLMTVNWGDEFKALHSPKAVLKPDMVRVAMLPGSSQVLDRDQNILVPCSLGSCPNRDLHTTISKDGDYKAVNRAPYPAFGGWMAGVSNKATQEQQQNAYDFFSWLSSPQVSWQDVLDPTHPAEPYRKQQLNDIERWVEAGYDRGLTDSYLTAIQWSLAIPNILMDPRLPYDLIGYGYRMPFEVAFINVSNPKATQAILEAAPPALETYSYFMMQSAMLKMRINPVELAQVYWDTIGKTGSVKAVLAARQPRDSQVLIEERTVQQGFIPAIAAPVIVAFVVAITAVVLYVKQLRKQQHRSLLGKVLAPGVGPNTTLVITDVQDSTSLYEALPVSCMDKCMQLTCSIIRSLLYKNNGYESATEGDSFIVAFHTANEAVVFCIELQEALLHAEWPEALYQTDGCASVQPVWVTNTELVPKCEQMLLGKWKQPSKPSRTSWIRSIAHRTWLGRWIGKHDTVARSEDTASQPGTDADYPMCDSNTFDSLLDTSGNIDGDKSGLLHTLELYESVDHPPGILDLEAVCDIDTHISAHGPGPQGPVSQANSGFDDRSSTKTTLQCSVRTRNKHVLRFTHPSVPDTMTVQQLISYAWPLSAGDDSSQHSASKAPTIVFQGLRVRCAVQSGLETAADTSFNKAAGRMLYSGSFLAATKAVEACTHGGQVLLSQSTFSLLDATRLSGVLLLHLGEHVIYSKKHTSLHKKSSQTQEDLESGQETPSQLDASKESFQLYTALYAKAAPRLALLAPPKTQQMLACGVLDAPVGSVTIGFMKMAGLPSILAWDANEAQQALNIFSSIVKQSLECFGGYMVEHVDGFVLVAFSNPLAALRFGMDVRETMLKAPWSPRLLQFGLAEEVAVVQLDRRGMSQRTVLLRGPRFKAGFDTGAAKSQVHATTGRMAYRGKVMNRAARIQSVATSGQVLCSIECWGAVMDAACLPKTSTKGGGLACTQTAAVQLKGIKDKIDVCQVHADVSNRRCSLLLAPSDTLHMM